MRFALIWDSGQVPIRQLARGAKQARLVGDLFGKIILECRELFGVALAQVCHDELKYVAPVLDLVFLVADIDDAWFGAESATIPWGRAGLSFCDKAGPDRQRALRERPRTGLDGLESPNFDALKVAVELNVALEQLLAFVGKGRGGERMIRARRCSRSASGFRSDADRSRIAIDLSTEGLAPLRLSVCGMTCSIVS